MKLSERYILNVKNSETLRLTFASGVVKMEGNYKVKEINF